jgi:hypothetical protein
MAPEQARARWDEVDGRTDLWAVGATMFTLMSGRFVHEGSSSNEQLILSATTHAPALATVVSDVPGPVAAIVDRALAFERERRWPDAATMQQAVRLAVEALGWSDPVVPSGQRAVSTGTVVSGTPSRAVTAVQTSAATMIDTTGKTSQVSAWTKERELRASETARIRAAIGEAQQRYAATKRHSADAQGRLEAGRAERLQLEQWFKRQVGTRTAAVEEARQMMRGQMVAIAKRAVTDHAAFGAELDAAREQIGKLERAAESAARDVSVHEAALQAHDARALRRGVVLLGVAAVLLVALLVGPIVWRATRVVEPPPLPSPVHTQPAPVQPAPKR